MSEKKKLTTIEDLLTGYQEEDVELSTGKVFRVQNFTPGSLMIEIGSPLTEMLIEATEESLRQTSIDIVGTRANIAWGRFEKVVCENVISVRFSPEPQKDLPNGIVSLQRLTLGEIRELYVAIRDLSISPEELETFRESYKTDENSEREELDKENREDSGESKRSIYSYLFRQGQYSMFFELAVENVITDLLDENTSGDDDVSLDNGEGHGVTLEPFEDIDWDAKDFKPFG